MTEEHDPAYSMEIDEVNGTAIITANKGILGPLANQLKHTSNKRKAASILRAMGHDISRAGDKLYGEINHEETVRSN